MVRRRHNRRGRGRRRVLPVVAAIVVGALSIWAVVYRHAQFGSRFAEIVPGQTQAQVVALLGPPDRALEDPTPDDLNCMHQWRYDQLFVEASFSICFDEDTRVQSVQHEFEPDEAAEDGETSL